MIKCLLTELGRAGRENIWPEVMAYGPSAARSVRHDRGPNIFPSGPPTQSISTYYALVRDKFCPKTVSINNFSSERVDSEGLYER